MSTVILTRTGNTKHATNTLTKSLQLTKIGKGSVTVDIEVSNNNFFFFPILTIELDNDTKTDGISNPNLSSWKYIRANVIELSANMARLDINDGL